MYVKLKKRKEKKFPVNSTLVWIFKKYNKYLDYINDRYYFVIYFG